MYRSHSSTFICTYDCVYYHVKCEKTADLCKRMISARASFALPVFPVAHVALKGFLHWIQFLPRWRLYQPDLVCHFLDVVLDDLDYNGRTYWAMIDFLETFCPWREMRLRLARLMLRIMASATATESTFRAAVKTLDETFPYADRGCLTDVFKIVVSDEKKFTKCLGAVLHMSDFFLIDDPERLASVRRLLLRVYKRPESLQETKRELLNLLTR